MLKLATFAPRIVAEMIAVAMLFSASMAAADGPRVLSLSSSNEVRQAWPRTQRPSTYQAHPLRPQAQPFGRQSVFRSNTMTRVEAVQGGAWRPTGQTAAGTERVHPQGGWRRVGSFAWNPQ